MSTDAHMAEGEGRRSGDWGGVSLPEQPLGLMSEKNLRRDLCFLQPITQAQARGAPCSNTLCSGFLGYIM